MRPRLPGPDAVLTRLWAIHDSGEYSNRGAQVRELEERYAEFLGVDAERVVVVASATAGLMAAIGASPAREWVVPSFAFPAAPAAVVHARRSLVLADIDPRTWWLDTAGLESGHMETKGADLGLLPVAPFGSAIDLHSWKEWPEVIIDAAASLGSDLPDLSTLTPGWAVIFSLHATKVLGCGEGGIIAFGSSDRALQARRLINFGFKADRNPDVIGFNGKMSEFQAAYAHAALDAWAEERAEWQMSRELADQVAASTGLRAAPVGRSGVTPYWMADFPDETTADLVATTLTTHGVDSRAWWGRGCHTMPAFSAFAKEPCPVVDSVSSRVLGLPMYRGMTEQEAERISVALDAARRLAGTW